MTEGTKIMTVKDKIDKLIEKYSKIPPAVKASIWFTICNFMQKGISLITVPIFTRLLTTEQYGLFSVYQSWYSVICIFATLNLAGGVFNNGMINYEDNRNSYISSMQGLSSLVTSGLFFIYLLNMQYFNSIFDLSSLFIITMFLQLLFEPAYLFWTAKNRFEFRYRRVVFVTLLISLTSPFLGIIAVLSTTYKVEARVLSYAFIQVCVGIIFYSFQLYKGKKIFIKNYWKFALYFNLPLIPHYLSQTVLDQSDRIMISRLVGADKAAIYSVAYNISSIMMLMVNAIESSFIPCMYRDLKIQQYKNIKKTANILFVIMGGMVLLLMIFGPEVIWIFGPKEYMEAMWVIPPVSLSVYFTFLYSIFINVQFYYERTKYVMWASIVGALTNILLNWFLIPVYGYVVSAYTTLFCYMLFAIGHYAICNIISKIYTHSEAIFDVKFIISLSSILLVLMLMILFSYSYNMFRYGLVVLVLLIFIIKGRVIISTIKSIMKNN